MYGGAAGGTIWQMDFDSETLIGTITGGFQSRAIAYDETGDGGDGTFMCSNWGDPVWVVRRDGSIESTFNLLSTTSTYGFAYDNMCGENILWIFDQGMGSGAPQYIHEYDLDTNSFTGFTYDVAADFPASSGIAGGLWIDTHIVNGTVTIGGCLQGTPDMMFAYELCTNPIVTDIIPLNGTNFAPGDVVEYRVEATNNETWGIPIRGETYAVTPRVVLPLFGPLNATLPGGVTGGIERDADIPPGLMNPLSADICADVEGSIDCYTISITP
jgi:hypothetical protein